MTKNKHSSADHTLHLLPLPLRMGGENANFSIHVESRQTCFFFKGGDAAGNQRRVPPRTTPNVTSSQVQPLLMDPGAGKEPEPGGLGTIPG